MTKLYHGAGSWQVPGQQDKGAQRVDVPNPPAELAAWLNARRVPRQDVEKLIENAVLDQLEAPQLASASAEDRTWQLGPPTKSPPRFAPAFLGDAESAAEFIPVAKAAEIDRLLQRCPRCHSTELAALIGRVRELELDELQTLAEAIRTHVGELSEQIEGSTVQ